MLKNMTTISTRSMISKSIFRLRYENHPFHLAISYKLYSKKVLNIKNNFTFSNKLNQIEHIYGTEGQIVSGDLQMNHELFPAKEQKPNKRKTEKGKSMPTLAYHGEILFGIHPVYLALLKQKRKFYRLFIHKDEQSPNKDILSRKTQILKLAESLNIPITFLDSKRLKILAPEALHQGVCLDVGFLPLQSWSEEDFSFENESSEKLPLWLVLDKLLDPMNVGAIIRSSYYFGVDKIFTVFGNSCKLSPIVSKASSGALEVMNMHQIENLEYFIKCIKRKNWSILSTLAYSENQTECNKTHSCIEEITMSKPTILILGNECKGVSENIQELCDNFISIKPGQSLHQGIDSLNVSVAAGVILYALNNSKNERR